VQYKPDIFKNENGEFDFSKASDYNEDLVRSNLNYVKRSSSTVIVKPLKEKEVVFIPPTNFVYDNLKCG
jgi:hypothetical protein